MGPGIFFHSTALPGVYLSPCMYLSPDLIWINTVLCNWIIDNHIHFNTSKCISLSFNMKHSTTHHTANNQLPQQASYRDLGVLSSSDLSWSRRYDHICANAYKSLGLPHRTFSNYHGIEAKKTLYITLDNSKLIYNSQLWNPHLIKDIISCTTKFILNDFTSNNKCPLSRLNMLHLNVYV